MRDAPPPSPAHPDLDAARGAPVLAAEASRRDAQLARIFTANPQPMWVYDARTLRFLDVNEAAVAAYGYTRDEFLSMTIADIRSSEEAGRLRDYIGARRATLREAWHSGVWRHRRKDGALLDVEVSGQPVPFVAPHARLVTVVDVTDRARAEHALAETMDTLRAVLEAVPEQVVVVDRDLRVRWITRPAPGFDAQALRGAPALELVHPDDRARVGALLRAVIDEGRTAEYDLRAARPSPEGGAMVWASRAAPLVREGVCAGAVVSTRDVTERVNAERERLETVERLERARRLESIGLLAGGIAHDFNNLLAGVLGNAALALADLAPGSPARERVEACAHAARRAAELAGRLLDSAGGRTPALQPVDMAALVEDALALAAPSLRPGARVRLRVERQRTHVMADPVALRRVVMNLVSNASDALRAAPDGEASGLIEVSVTPRDLTEAEARALLPIDPARRAGACVELSVRDDGEGMSPETIARVFTPFFTTKPRGRGLGLPAVMGIVRAHRAGVEVVSAPGAGTTFRAVFPAATEQGEAAPAGAAPTPAPGAPPAPGAAPPTTHAPPAPRAPGARPRAARVLVIDDEPAVRDMLAAALRRLGHEPRTAPTGDHALALLQHDREPLDLAIVDASMPGLIGAPLLSALRRLRPGVPVVLTSGHANDDIAGLFGIAGGALILPKPFSLDELRAALDAGLGGGGV